MAGRLVRCACDKCSRVEMRPGRNSNFLCSACRKDVWPDSPQAHAHRAVAVAVRSGVLKPARECTCADCGKPAIEYDHRDYAKPLEVEPVCRRCNRHRGPALNHTVTRWTARKDAGLLYPREFVKRA